MAAANGPLLFNIFQLQHTNQLTSRMFLVFVEIVKPSLLIGIFPLPYLTTTNSMNILVKTESVRKNIQNKRFKRQTFRSSLPFRSIFFHSFSLVRISISSFECLSILFWLWNLGHSVQFLSTLCFWKVVFGLFLIGCFYDIEVCLIFSALLYA